MNAMSFDGNGIEYFKIWIVNILLTIVTLGLYYPWAKVRTNRYFYANSGLEGRQFDYHATGKQLFLGYLIAMSLFVLYIIIQNVSAEGGILVFFVFVAAVPWIVWRSLKFNMRITSFSNVRFSFEGSLGQAYFNYLLLPILFFLALYAAPIVFAFYYPSSAQEMSSRFISLMVVIALLAMALAVYLFALMKKRNTSYVINSSRYGQGKFSTQLETSKFVLILCKTIGLFFASMFAFMMLTGLLSFAFGLSGSLLELSGNLEDPEAINDALGGGTFGLIALTYLGFIFVSLLVFSYFFTRQRSYILANSKLDGKISLASTLKARSLAWVSISNFAAIIFSLGLAIPWAAVRMARLILSNTEVDTSLGFDDYVTQQQNEQSSLGEQIGDAFDVDVGLGF